MYKRLSGLLFGLLALVLATGLVGCDSNDDDDATETELFVGSWTAVSAIGQVQPGQQGDFLAVLGARLDADFAADGSFSWFLDFADPNQQDVPLSGTYVVNETTDRVTVTGGLFPQGVPMAYEFVGEDQLELTFQAAVLGAVVGIEVPGDVVLTLARD